MPTTFKSVLLFSFINFPIGSILGKYLFLIFSPITIVYGSLKKFFLSPSASSISRIEKIEESAYNPLFSKELKCFVSKTPLNPSVRNTLSTSANSDFKPLASGYGVDCQY